MSDTRAGVSYLAVVTESTDEAQSLASYLNDHGVVAFHQEGNEISCPVERGLETMAKIETLRGTWGWFREHSETGVLGLTMSLFEVPN